MFLILTRNFPPEIGGYQESYDRGCWEAADGDGRCEQMIMW